MESYFHNCCCNGLLDAAKWVLSVKPNVDISDSLFRDVCKFGYIDIEDTGKGIPKSKFKTVFKPGFTTKKRGWGLGLSLVKRIVESYHNGTIYVRHSELGKGTTFRIVLQVE